MELKVTEYQLPESIQFNFEELKSELVSKAETYANMIYTDADIKSAKEDRADLNRLKKALNDERLRRQKEYMKPFDKFKAQVDEIISIIDRPCSIIDQRVKEYEQAQKEKRTEVIKDLFTRIGFPEWLKIEQIWNDKWLNASTSVSSIENDMNKKKDDIMSELASLATIPDYSAEAQFYYKESLDVADVLQKVRKLSDMAKAKKEAEERAAKEAEARRAEEEAKRAETQETQTDISETTSDHIETGSSEEIQLSMGPAPKETYQWVAFEANLCPRTAALLRDFFAKYKVEFRPIKKEDK